MRVAKAAKFVAMVIVFCVVAGFVVRELWNWLMPALFGLKAVTFLQAIGLVVLSKILRVDSIATATAAADAAAAAVGNSTWKSAGDT